MRFTHLTTVAFCLTMLVSTSSTVRAGAVAEDRSVVINWNSHFRIGGWVEKDELALRHSYVLGESSTLWVEAEESSVVSYSASGETRKEESSGGGQYAYSPERFELFLDVKKPGKYWSWYRLRAPGGVATIKHLEGVDVCYGAGIGWVSNDVQPNQWVWVRREVPWDFQSGSHELQMDQWTPGVAVDRIVLADNETWTPPAERPGDKAATPTLWSTGIAFTSDAFFAAVMKWKKVELTQPAGQRGNAVLKCSTDGGKQWLDVPANGDLSALETKGDGTDRIRFRVDMKRDSDNASPVVGPIRLTYTGERDDLFAIEDTTARYSFAKRTGALSGIQNKVTGTQLTPLRRPQPLFSIRLRPHDSTLEKDWDTVTSLDAKCLAPGVADKGKRKTWKFVYEIVRDDGKATVTLLCSQTGDGELTWTAEVTNNLTRHDVVDLTYPIVDSARISPNPADDTALLWGGYLVKNPATFGHFLYYWPTLTAPLLDLFNEREGLTVVAHDRTMRSTGISCLGQDRRAVQLSLVKVVRVKPGATFKGEPHLVRVHQGDWHTTGLIERKWFASAFPTVESPLWLQECDGWVPAGWPMGWWTDLGEYAKKKQAKTEFGYVQFWNFQTPGTTWTIAHPNQANGSAEELRWGIDQMHRAGTRATFYIQGLLYDPHADGDSPDDVIGHLHRRDLWPGFELPKKGFAEKWAARDADGKTNAWSETELEMCYASDGFKEYKRHWAVDLLMGKLGADGIYWDSLSRGRTCWATDHGHGDDPGMWGMGAQENHRQIREQGKKLNPDAVFSLEGPPVDTLGAVADIHLDNAPSLDAVRFLFPKMLVYLGAADGADVKRRKSFLYGCRFDGIDTDDPSQVSLLRIRRLTKQYLYPATPTDTMGLNIEGSPSVKARMFVCDPSRTRGAVVTILNEEKATGTMITVDTSAFGPVKLAWIVDADGHDGPLPGGEALNGGKGFRFSVPASFASSVLLLNTAEPRVTVDPVEPLARGGTTTVTVHIESLMGERLRGTVLLATPREFGASPVAFDVTGYGGNGQTVAFALTATDAARLGLVDFPVEVSVTGGPKFRKVATVYVEQPVRVTPDWVKPDLLRVTVMNRSTQWRAGQVTLTVATREVKFGGPDPKWRYELKAGEGKVFEVGLVGAFKCEVPWAVKGEASFGKDWLSIYAPFRPPILNGSFERNRFRSDVPDYWWGTHVDRSPKIWGTGEFAIDDSVAADGKHSLRLVGNDKEWRAANLDIQLKPSTRYRFHVQIRRTANSPNIYASIWEGRRLPDGKTDAVAHIAGQQKEGPLNEWQTFETTFTSLPASEQNGCRLYLYNMNTPATVWADDIHLVPEYE